jgi:hypothetical protein
VAWIPVYEVETLVAHLNRSQQRDVMNNLSYMGQDGRQIAPKVEELLRKELAAEGTIAYTVKSDGETGITAKSVLSDVSASLFGGKITPVLGIHFDIAQPRPTHLNVYMMRKGLGCVAGSLEYSTALNKRLAGEVVLGDDGKFTGNADAASKLNAKKDLLKKCGAFAMREGGLAGSEIKIQRMLKIRPQEGGAQIVAVTLPRSKSMGFSASLGSKEFLEIVGLLEATL